MPVESHPDQEPATRCVHCPRLLHFDELDRWACRVCEDRAQQHIAELRTWYPQLAEKLHPGSSGGSNTGHVTGATRTAPLPLAIGALDLIAPGGVVTKLRTIEDDWRKTLGWTIAPFRGNDTQTLTAVIPFLRNNIGWACDRYEDVAEDLKLIRILHGRVDAVINGRKEAQVPVGCCPVVTADQVPCGEKLKVSPFACEIKCVGCGTRWARDEWLRLGATLRGLITPAMAAA